MNHGLGQILANLFQAGRQRPNNFFAKRGDLDLQVGLLDRAHQGE